jgi:hypothetical protein
MEFGIRWTYFDRNSRTVTKERFFRTERARDRFADKVMAEDNFFRIEAFCDSASLARFNAIVVTGELTAGNPPDVEVL